MVDPSQVLEQFGGIPDYDLVDKISKLDASNERPIISHYYETEGISKILCHHTASKFIIGSLNIDSLRSKKDTHLLPAIKELAKHNIKFHALCIQESYLEETADGNNNLSLADYQIEGYHPISQGKSCGRKGGLFIFLCEEFEY